MFDADIALESVADQLRAALDLDELPDYHVEELNDQPWERAWLKDFGPMQFGRSLWIIPGDAEPPADDAVVVRLDPGLAFGTGTHATTALCLEWLEGSDLHAKTVFDFGCGSGVLGIAALKLGAASVVATDIDLQAISATRQNAERNGVGANLAAAAEVAPTQPGFDIVVANILAGTLIDNVEFICDAVTAGGKIALSGILAGQVEDVSEHYRRFLSLDKPRYLDGWALVSGRRN